MIFQKLTHRINKRCTILLIPKSVTQLPYKCPALTLSPQEPKLWYGIGILYDRYGSFEHAEEAFSSVLKVDPSKSILISDETL